MPDAQILPTSTESPAHADNAQLRVLADALPQLIWRSSPDGLLNYCNQPWISYTGLTLDQSRGDGWTTALHADDLPACKAGWCRALASGDSFEIEYRLKRAADGMYRWYLARAVACSDRDGAIVSWFGTCTDIDEQKQTQAALRQTHQVAGQLVAQRSAELVTVNALLLKEIERHKQAAEQTRRATQRLTQIIETQALLAQAQLEHDSFINLVVEKIAVLTNASGAMVEKTDGEQMVYVAATGVAAGFIGSRIEIRSSLSGLCVRQNQVLRCDDSASDARVDLTMCQSLNARSLVVAPLLRDGAVIGVLKIISDRSHGFEDGDVQTLQLMAGLIGAAIGHQQDFDANQRLLIERTEALEALTAETRRRIETEAAVRRSEQRTRAILESSHDAFVGIDQLGRVTEWNLQAQKAFGWSFDEAVGRNLSELIVPERHRAAHNAGMARFQLSGNGPVIDRRIEMPALRRNREEFPVELIISKIRNGNGYEFFAFLHDITERKLAEQQLLHMAQNDQLTALPNRILFNDRIAQAIERSKRSKKLMALMYLDIDFFKRINDTLGHVTGDGLLKEFATRLRVSVRATDTVARIGGDEFTVIMEELQKPGDAELIANKILKKISERFLIALQPINITTSIGIAFYQGEKVASEHLIVSADQAMYQAKQQGRNRFWIAPALPEDE